MSFVLGLDKRLRSNTLVKLASDLVGRLATFILTLWAARQLGEAGFGLYSYGLAMGFVVSQIADAGIQILMSREVAISGHQARPLVQTALRLKLLLSLPVFLLLILLSSGRPLPVQVAFLSLGLAMVLQTFLEFVAYIFRGQQRLQKEARLLASARVVTAVVGGATLWLGGGLPGLGLATLGTTGLMTAWALWQLSQEGWLRPSIEVEKIIWPGLLRQAAPLGVATFLSIAYTRLAIFLLEYRLDEIAVAQFSAAHRLVEPTQILPAALLAAVFPAFAGALRSDPDRAYQLGLSSSLILAAAGAALASLFWLTGPLLIPALYGPDFQGSVPVFQFLALAILPAYINYSLTHILIARGQQLFIGIFMALMLTGHALLSWRLIPILGAAGPAISTIFAEMLLFLCCALTLRFYPYNK